MLRRTILFAAVMVGLVAGRWARANDTAQPIPSITVVGEGEVFARPDQAGVTLGVTTEAKTAAEALQVNNERMKELLETLKQHQIPSERVLTTNFSISPQQVFDRDGRHPRIVGYQVTNQVNVTRVPIGQLGVILDAVVQVGSNQIHGVNFSIADPKPHLEAARRKAIEDARQRAGIYADEAQVRLGKPLLIQEQSAAPPRPVFAQAMRAAAAEVPIAAGEQSITAQITVTFAIGE